MTQAMGHYWTNHDQWIYLGHPSGLHLVEWPVWGFSTSRVCSSHLAWPIAAQKFDLGYGQFQKFEPNPSSPFRPHATKGSLVRLGQARTRCRPAVGPRRVGVSPTASWRFVQLDLVFIDCCCGPHFRLVWSRFMLTDHHHCPYNQSVCVLRSNYFEKNLLTAHLQLTWF